VRTSTRIGIVGSSVAVAGSAALAAFAPSAGATTGQASSARYNSTATATVGSVDIDGNAQSLLTTTATSGDSPHSASIGSGQVLSALQGVPTLGPALVTAFEKANPGGTDLVTESATASPDGTSTACAAILAADCTTKPMSLILNLGLGDLPAASSSSSSSSSSSGGSGNPISSVLGQVGQAVGKVTGRSSQAAGQKSQAQASKGSNLLDYSLTLTINGPRASCSAGPAGSGDLSATDNPAGATVDLLANGKSVLPGGPISVSGGDIFKQLLSAVGGTQVGTLLSDLEGKAPLALTLDPNSRKYTSGSKATATAGEVGLSSGGTTLFDVKAATVTCGPNTQAATTSTSSSSTTAPTGTSGEKPLTGIHTDEGRWVPPARSDALWIGLAAGGAVLAGGTSGLSLWRRRLHR
jgi:hypothetical protein